MAEGTNEVLKMIAQAIKLLEDYNIADEESLISAIDLLKKSIDVLAG